MPRRETRISWACLFCGHAFQKLASHRMCILDACVSWASLSRRHASPYLSRRTRVVSPASHCFPRIRLAIVVEKISGTCCTPQSLNTSCNLNIVWVTSYLQGLGTSDCKRELTRDRRKSETANRSTAMCGWALRPILVNWQYVACTKFSLAIGCAKAL
jgi:hypothetical protein